MALDDCHPQMVNALRKAGWDVDAKSFYIEVPGMVVAPDIRARHTNGKGQQLIVVEIKCFTDENSQQDELYRAVGQYIVYRNVLRLKPIAATLYLAIPLLIYQQFFTTEVVMSSVKDAHIKLVIVDIEREEVIQWLE